MTNQTIQTIYKDVLPKLWEEYEPRKGQEDISYRIESAFQRENSMIIEAGTGTGKSLSYLIPAILKSLKSKTQVVISTETIQLQEQLIHKDIPLLRKIINEEFKVEVAYGSSNYLCKRRMNQVFQQGNLPPMDKIILDKFIDFTKSTQSGLVRNFELPLPPSFKDSINRNPDDCLARNCPNYHHSYYFLEKEKWKNANLLIINHSLLATHIVNGGSILPTFQSIVIDEAHHFPEILSKAFHEEFSMDFVYKFYGRFLKFEKNDPLNHISSEEHNQLKDTSKDIISKFENFFYQLDSKMPLGKESSKRISSYINFEEEFLVDSLIHFDDCILELYSKYPKDSDDLLIKNLLVSLDGIRKKNRSIIQLLEKYNKDFLGDHVFWIEKSNQGITQNSSFHYEPISSRELFDEFTEENSITTIFTSATLSAGKKGFRFFNDQISNHEIDSLSYQSPFSYQNNMILFIPDDLYDPLQDPLNYQKSLERWIETLTKLSNGNTFVLFTSYKQMNDTASSLKSSLQNPFFVQGKGNSNLILKEFLDTPNSILFGVNSFWQGVDIRGDKLSSVIIAKLPFQVPTEPILESKMERLKSKGLNPFAEIQLPSSILLLKQGVGRLIRSSSDKGIVTILDQRIITKNYGKEILESLPTKPLIGKFQDLNKRYQKLYEN